MPDQPKNHSSKLRDIGFIFYRNLFLLTNAIIFAVVGMLFFFGATTAALFLGIISIISIALALAQDIHAWRALDKLQSLTAPRAVRRSPGGLLETILTEHIRVHDMVVLKIGDQIPCDGELKTSLGLEVTMGLITGESKSIAKKTGDKVLGGSVVTAGSGEMEAESLADTSQIARMTSSIKKYSVHSSPLQRSVSTIIKISGYVLFAVLIVAIVRGNLLHQSVVEQVLHIAALTSAIVPQGLTFSVTLFFAYGAAHLFKRHILLQEINATEKLGCIKNLCMDKTGTLTENTLAVEAMHLAPGMTKEEASNLAAAYTGGTNDTSQTAEAMKKFLGNSFSGKISSALAFSSGRKYGAVLIEGNSLQPCVIVGAPSVFLPSIKDASERKWLEDLLVSHAPLGKSIVAIARTDAGVLPEQISDVSLSMVSVFVFFNTLREGIQDTVDFFQKRGVHIRIISGDNAAATSAVAAAAGIKKSSFSIMGTELSAWSDEDYTTRVSEFTVFAGIIPEQKEKIVSAFKKNGFTAMIGDGANDALAIKKADLGIAMFDGAPATRQLASVILTNNSFAALPGGVELADCIIRNIEIFSSIFLSQCFASFLFFCILSIGGFSFPFTPFNITLINYCTVAIPGVLISYWTIRPPQETIQISEKTFLHRVVPFAFSAALIQALGAAGVYAFNLLYGQPSQTGTLGVLVFCLLGFVFFILTPLVYNGRISLVQKKQMFLFFTLDVLLLVVVFYVPLLSLFFNVSSLSFSSRLALASALVMVIFAGAEYLVARFFSVRKKVNEV